MRFVWKILVFLLGVGIVAYVFFNFKIWQDDFVGYFLKAGKWTELIFVFLIGYLVLHLFEILLKMQARVSR